MKYDLAIVGGGILGMAHAYHAARQGLNVLVLEKDAAPAGSTTMNFGQVVPSGLDKNWFKFGIKSLEHYQNIQKKFDINLRQNGSIYLASNDAEEALINELADYHKSTDYPAKLLTKKECLTKYPVIKPGYCKAGLFFSSECSVEPNTLIFRFIEYFKDIQNGTYLPSHLVSHINPGTDRVDIICTNNKTFKATKVLVCCGFTMNILYPQVFADSGLVISKLQMMQTIPQKYLKMDGNILSGLSIRRYESFTEMPSYQNLKTGKKMKELQKWGIHILFKQAIDGSIIIGDSHEYIPVTQLEKLDYTNNDYINFLILSEAKAISPISRFNIAKKWNGWYSQHKDGIFLKKIHPRVSICTGIGGKGMTTSLGFADHNLNNLLGL